MKTKIFFFAAAIFLIAATITFTGCKKYPDGPWLSARTKKARITNVWRSGGAVLNIKDDGTYVDTYAGVSSSGTWRFSYTAGSNIHSGGINLYRGFKGSVIFSGMGTFLILKLEHNDLWLTKPLTSSGGYSNYEIKYTSN